MLFVNTFCQYLLCEGPTFDCSSGSPTCNTLQTRSHHTLSFVSLTLSLSLSLSSMNGPIDPSIPWFIAFASVEKQSEFSFFIVYQLSNYRSTLIYIDIDRIDR